MYDWLSIVMSGHIECHGFDQAALEMLIMTKVYGEMVAAPLNFTCRYPQNCDSKKSQFSCDLTYEIAFDNAGFKTDANNGFWGDKYSSFSKGCANDYIPEFHIVSETSTRPRLSSGFCSRQNEIGAVGHGDGPLGGGNDRLRFGTLSSWMFNHKSEWLFFESYLNPKNCKKVNDLVLNCREDLQNELLSTPKLSTLISLTDGYAFDLSDGLYCKLSKNELLDIQKKTSYMNEYPEYMKIANSYSDDEWHRLYLTSGQTWGRSLCPLEPNKAINQECLSDNMKPNNLIFERETDFCGKCEIIEIKNYFGSGRSRKVVDCRSPEIIRQERLNAIE